MAIKTIRVFAEYTSDGYVPMPSQGNIDYGVTVGSSFPETQPSSYQTDDPNIDVAVTTMTDFYVWIRTHGSSWNPSYTRVVRVYPDSPSINSVVMNMIVAVGSAGTTISSGGGVNYYLNGGTSQGTLDGSTYYEMSKTPVTTAMVDFFKINTTGFENIAQFVTDAGDPGLLNIPAGSWPLGFYMSASNNTGAPKFYAEIYKFSAAGVFTLLGSSVSIPEVITNGQAIDYYISSVTIPETTLLVTDRIAIRIFVNTDGNRQINLHTQDSHLSTVGTTFTRGLTAINGLIKQVQFLAIGNAGSDAAIVSSDDTHTINLPTASATKRGLLNSTDWSTFNAKQPSLSGDGFVKISGSTISYDNSSYQPLDGDLTAIGALAGTSGILKKTGANTWELDTTTYLSTTVAASTYQRLDKMVSNLLASDTEYPNSNAVLAALALKANATNPAFSGYLTITGASPKIYLTDTDNNPDYFIGNDDGYFRIYDQTNTVSRFYITSLGVSTFPGDVIVGSIAKSGGLASQFLKADGSVDANTYVTSGTLSSYLLSATAASTYQRLDKMVSNLLASDTEYPNSNAVLAKLALKADALNPAFTGYMTISGASPKLYLTDTDNNPDYFIGNDDGYFRIYDQTATASRFYITALGVTTIPGDLIVGTIAKSGGTSAQFLKADGTVDSSTYVTSTTLSSYLLTADAVSTYQRKDKMVSNLLASDTEYPNSNAVIAALALKANAANPTFTGDFTISGATPRLYFVDTDQNPDYTVFVDSGFFYIYDQTAGATRFSINSSGNISTAVGKSITAGSFVKDGGTANQYLMADGSVTTLSGVVTGSGTGNYITKWATGSTIGNSIIYDNGSSVGIGATTLARKLEVITGNGVTDGIRLTYANGVVGEGVDITYLNTGATTTSFDSLYNSAAAVMQFRMKTAAAPLTVMSIFGSGNVSIGTIDQGHKLAVNGTARFYDTLQFSAGDRGLECSGSAGVSFYSNEINSGSLGVTGDLYFGWRRTNTLYFGVSSVFSSNIIINGGGSAIKSGNELRFYRPDNAIYTRMYDAGSLAANGFTFDNMNAEGFHFKNNGTTIMRMPSNGYVGIGTTSPQQLLHISATNASMQVQSTTGGQNANVKFVTTARTWSIGPNQYFSDSSFEIVDSSAGARRFSIDTSGNAYFVNYLSATRYIIQPNGTGQVYNIVNANNSYAGSYTIQAGEGSSGYGGSMTMWGHSHASRAGYVSAGISAGSGGRFTVMNQAIGNGTDLFSVCSSGNVLINTTTDAGHRLYVAGQTIAINNETTAEFRAQGGGYGTSYNTSLRSEVGATGVLQFGNNGGNVVLIGNTNTGGWLDFRTNVNNESITSGSLALRLNSNASATFYSSVTATSFFESSDIRLKTLIESNPIIKEIEKLEAKLYEKNGKIELGYFAQDAEKIMPYAVTKNDEGFLNLSYREVHTAKIARLEQRVAELEKQLNVA